VNPILDLWELEAALGLWKPGMKLEAVKILALWRALIVYEGDRKKVADDLGMPQEWVEQTINRHVLLKKFRER